MKRILKLTLLALLILVSCTNNASDPEDIAIDSWEGIFKRYWSVMNTEYVQFDYDDIDWDEVYTTYLPLFRDLDYTDEGDSLEAFRLFKETSKDLKDNHYMLEILDNFGNSLFFYSAYERKYAEAATKSIMDYPDIYLKDYSIVSVNKPNDPATADPMDSVEGYTEIKDMGANFHNSSSHSFKETIEGGIDIDESGNKNIAAYLEIKYDLDFFFGITEDNIAYFYFSSYAIHANYIDLDYLHDSLPYVFLSEDEKKTVDDVLGKLNAAFRALLSITATNQYEGNEIKGIVLDLRNNCGGYGSLEKALSGLFFKDCDSLIGYERYKNGYSRYDYTPYYEDRTSRLFGDIPAPEKDYERPVAILTNSFTISASEITAIALKNLPSCHIFGTNTFGATCGLSERRLFHSGSYESDGHRLYIYTPSHQFVDRNFKRYEVTGIAPDTVVKPNKNNDDCFETAVSWILGEYTE